jgi:hypothetical protein
VCSSDLVNLLQRTLDRNYDCLILGSSRVTGLHAAGFEGQRCFNFALKGAEGPEILAYGRFASELGVDPKSVYVGIDDFNFVENKATERRSNPVVSGTASLWRAYFSIDVLTFSLMTLADVSPDPFNYYDAAYEFRELREPNWKPVLVDRPDLKCDPRRIGPFLELRKVFPGARLVAYAPPIAPAQQISEIVSRGVLDCELDTFYEIARTYDAFYDFGIPSPLTLDARNTSDGSHFTPQSNDRVVGELQGNASGLSLDVKAYPDAATYRADVRGRLRDYLVTQDRLDLWRE